MDPNRCCPFCVPLVNTCPHLLVSMGLPGEVLGGALGERLRQLWEIVIMSVGDDPATDARGVYADSWRELCDRFSTEADLVIEGESWTALYVADPSRLEDTLERCISADDL